MAWAAPVATLLLFPGASMIARSALLSRASSRAYRKRLACAETMTGISAAHRSFHFTALVTRLALTTLLELRSGCGTNRLCRPVCKNFRNWRFTGLTMAVPVLLSLTRSRQRRAEAVCRKVRVWWESQCCLRSRLCGELNCGKPIAVRPEVENENNDFTT